MKSYVLVSLLLVVYVRAADAETSKLRTVGEYCSVVQARIVRLAEAQVTSNADTSKYANDQTTANANKFKEARQKLESFSASLKENEEEWARLGCIHIYPR